MKRSLVQILKWSGWVVLVYVITAMIARKIYDIFFPDENIFSIPRFIATFIPALIASVIFSRRLTKRLGTGENEA